MRISRFFTALVLAPLATLLLSSQVRGQHHEKMAEGFDPDRAMLNDEPWFDPFRPTEYEALADALDDGKVAEDTPLLVLERDGKHLGLMLMQMTYHHVAQGELDGEPWMVSF